MWRDGVVFYFYFSVRVLSQLLDNCWIFVTFYDNVLTLFAFILKSRTRRAACSLC